MRRNIVAIVTTIMNFKGGVGKTTIAMNLGYCLFKMGKRVLLIDLDPQFNLSQYILGYEKYSDLIINNIPTTHELFEENNPLTPHIPVRDIDDYVHHVKHNKSGRLDLIASKLELYYTMQNSRNTANTLMNKFNPILEDYDVILFDCPPTISVISEAAFYVSNYVLIPIMPEFLCTIGLPLLYQSIMSFRQSNAGATMEIIGAVINNDEGYAPEGYRAINDIEANCKKYNIPLFDTRIEYSRSYPSGARQAKPISSTPYSRWDKIRNFETFVNEFISRGGCI